MFPRARLIAASLLAVALVALATGCSRTPASKAASLSPAEKASLVASASAVTSDSVAVKSADSTGSTTSGSVGGAVSGSTSTSTSAKKATKQSAKQQTKKPANGAKPVATMKVLIMFWNDTSSKTPEATEIIIGGSTFKPKTSAKTDRGTLVAVPYDKEVQIVVYPDGRGGKKISVPLTVDKGMVPNSEQDGIHVAISDGSVRILGNAISNIDHTIPRF